MVNCVFADFECYLSSMRQSGMFTENYEIEKHEADKGKSKIVSKTTQSQARGEQTEQYSKTVNRLQQRSHAWKQTGKIISL